MHITGGNVYDEKTDTTKTSKAQFQNTSKPEKTSAER
jgi:hypothetical protein